MASLSWSGTSFDYDGAQHAPTATVSNLLSGDTCAVTVTGGQKDAGSHTATASALNNPNYTLSGSPTCPFTIKPKKVALEWTGDSFTYNGAQQAPTAALVSGDTCAVTVSGAQRDVGSYTATATLDNANYELESASESHAFAITPKEVELEWGATSFTYNGSDQAPTATVKGSSLEGSDSCTVTVSGAKTPAGTWTATATALSNRNYKLPSGASTQFTIGKASLTVKAKDSSIVYGDAAANAGCTFTGLVGGDTEGSLGTVSYAYADTSGNAYAVGSDVGGYTITPSGLTEDNYSITYETGTMTVGQLEARFDWSVPAAFDYDGNEKAWPAPAIGNKVGSDDVAAVWATASGDATDKATDAGTYKPVVGSLAGAKASNYKLPAAAADRTGSWSIDAPAANSMTLSVSDWTYGKHGSSNGPKVTADFGAANVQYAYYTDAACTTPVDSGNIDTAATPNVPKNAGEYWVKATIPGTANYPAAEATAKFTISKAKITVTADDKVSVWSTADPFDTLTCTVSGDVASWDNVADIKGSYITLALPSGASRARTGRYDISVTAAAHANYDIDTVDGTYTVTRALANVASSGYSGVYDGAADTEKISVSATGPGGRNYANTAEAGLTIYYSEKPFTEFVDADVLSKLQTETDISAGSAFATAWASLQTALSSNTDKYQTADFVYSAAGQHTVYFMIVSDQVAPDVVVGSELVDIRKAPLTVTAKGKSIAYGAAADNDGVEYSGFVNSESESALSGSLSYAYGTYEAGSPVGRYPITPSGLTSSNYDITFADGTLTVGKKELDVTWPVDERVYNGREQTCTGPTLVGVASGDDVSVELSAGTDKATDVGGYTATIARLTGAAAANYALPGDASKLRGAWSITPAPLKVKARPKSIVYGEAPANDGVDYEGLLGSDGEASLGGALAYAYTYARFGGVGSYTITPSGLTSANYSIEFVPGALTVEPRPLTLAWPELDSFAYTGREIEYGQPALEGILNGDDVSIGTYEGYKATDAGTHTAEVKDLAGAAAGNYALPSERTHGWTIVGAANEATVKMESWTYGDEPASPEATATFGTDTVAFSYAASADGPWSDERPTAAGSYWVRATVPAGASYDGAEATAQFAIAKRPLTVTALDQVVLVGGAIDASARMAKADGLVAGDALSAVTLTPTSTAKPADNGTITPFGALVTDAAGANMSSSYDVTYVPGKLVVAGAFGAENGKVIYVLAKDVWMTVDEASALLASGDVDTRLIALTGAAARETATGEALPVTVADRGGLAAKVGDYPVTFKTNPEVTATVHVTDAAKPAADGGSAEKPATTRAASKGASPATGDAPLALTAGLLLGSAIVAAAALMLARRQARRRGHHAR